MCDGDLCLEKMKNHAKTVGQGQGVMLGYERVVSFNQLPVLSTFAWESVELAQVGQLAAEDV